MNSRQLSLALASMSLLPTALTAQDVLSLLRRDSLDWSHWETRSPATLSLIQQARLCQTGNSTRASGRHDLTPFYHILDFSGDARADVIYSGWNLDRRTCTAAEGALTVLFESEGDTLAEVFTDHATVVGAWRATPWHPLSLTLRADGCCGDFYVHWTFVRPSLAPSLRWDEYDHLVGTYMTLARLPRAFFDRPRPFITRQPQYHLRAEPIVDDTSESPLMQLEQRGNVLATYDAGATGVALAEARDSEGRIWWLVVMNPGKLLRIAGESAEAVARAQGHRRLGWMSARFLTPPQSP